MRENEFRPTINPFQLTMFEFAILVGVGFLTMPRGVVEKAGEDAWLSVILAGVLMVASLWLIVRVVSHFPQETVFDYNVKLFGKAIGFLFNLSFGVYYFFFTVTGVRVMAEVVRTEMLPFTPLEMIISAMLLVLLYSSWNGLMPLVRIYESGLPVTFFFIIMFFLLAYGNAEWYELRIPFQNGVSPIIQAIPYTIYSYVGHELLFLYYPYVTDKKRTFSSVTAGLALGGCFYVFLVLGTLVTLGPYVTVAQTFPIVTLAKTIEVVRQFVERAELLLIILWLPLAYTTHVGFFFSSAFSFNRVFPGIPIRWWLVLLLPAVLVTSLVPDNLLTVQEWSDKVALGGLFYTFPYPLLLLACIFVRRKFGGRPSRKEGAAG